MGKNLPSRLNWGCGGHLGVGWINSDIRALPGVDLVADIRKGLPLPTNSMAYVYSSHALPALSLEEQVPALRELRRVIKPGGVLRLSLPDFDKAIRAYRSRRKAYFLVPDRHVRSLGGKLIVQMTWYGESRTLFTHDFVAELLRWAGFERVRRCRYKETLSRFPEIVMLDHKARESLFVEAIKANGRRCP